MTRTQWCREHIDQTAEECGLEKTTVSDVKQAAKFCDEHSALSECSTRAVIALIRVPDEMVREKVLSSIKKSFESGKHPLTGAFLKKKALTESEVKKMIAQADIEVRKELMKDPPETKPPRPAPAPAPVVVKPSRCMYLTRDEQNCTAPGPILKTCDEDKRRDRGCTLTLTERDPVLYEGSRVSGTAFSPTEKTVSAVVRRETAQDEVRMSASYEVESGRYSEGAIRQIVQRRKAVDEGAAAQLAFNLGIERLMDEIESEIQAESEGLIEDEA